MRSVSTDKVVLMAVAHEHTVYELLEQFEVKHQWRIRTDRELRLGIVEIVSAYMYIN